MSKESSQNMILMRQTQPLLCRDYYKCHMARPKKDFAILVTLTLIVILKCSRELRFKVKLLKYIFNHFLAHISYVKKLS